MGQEWPGREADFFESDLDFVAYFRGIMAAG
jgi:hypothetical protein